MTVYLVECDEGGVMAYIVEGDEEGGSDGIPGRRR